MYHAPTALGRAGREQAIQAFPVIAASSQDILTRIKEGEMRALAILVMIILSTVLIPLLWYLAFKDMLRQYDLDGIRQRQRREQ